MSSIHENLKYFRKVKGMTQADVADAVNVTRQTVSSYESGRTQPDLETLKNLAEIYEIDIYDILYGDSRIKQRIKFLHYTVFSTIIILILGLLIHSVLLWTINNYFIVESGGITDANRQIIEIRFNLLNIANMAINISSSIFQLGCLVFLFLIISQGYNILLRIQIGWALGIMAISFAVVIPWSLNDRIYGYMDYIIPTFQFLFHILLTLIVSSINTLIRKMLKSKNKNQWY